MQSRHTEPGYRLDVAGVLPDILGPDLRVVFCGTAPGRASAAAGAYYAGPGNRFWQTIWEVGLTPLLLPASEYARLPEFGIGLTDICKVSYGSDQELGTTEFDLARLQSAIATSEPRRLAFNGKNAARGALERQVQYGPQSERVGGAEIWVLPSTSGRARRFWDPQPWADLARACQDGDQR